MKKLGIILTIMTTNTSYAKWHSSLQLGITHQSGNSIVYRNQTQSNYDYVSIIEKIYNSFKKNIKILTSTNYYLSQDDAEVTFSGTLVNNTKVLGGFGENLYNWDFRNQKQGAEIENHIPETEKKITQIFADSVALTNKDVPVLQITTVQPVKIIGDPGYTTTLQVLPVYAKYGEKQFKIIYGSGENRDGSTAETLPHEYFANATTLHEYLLNRYVGGFLRDYPELYKQTISENDAPRGAKLKMLFGGSVGYSHTFMGSNKKFGLYTGVDLFFDTCPNRTNISKNSIGIKQNNIGITPFIGIAAKDSWMLYAIGGPKLSFKNLSFKNTIIKKNKIEFEVGAGTDYMLTDHFAVGFKYLKTLKSNIKFKHNSVNYKLRTSSSKFVLSLSYVF